MATETQYNLPPVETTLTESDVQRIIDATLSDLGSTILKTGTGNQALKAGPDGLWLGNADFGSAPFRVNLDGDLTATSATLTGSITATSGAIGGFDISATTLASSTNIILDASNKAISINDATFGNAGIQLEYNSGTPRAYIGDGSTKFLQFDGTNVSVGGNITILGGSGIANLSDAGTLATGNDADDVAESVSRKWAGASGADFVKASDDADAITEGASNKFASESGADVTGDHAGDVVFRQSAAPTHKAGRIWIDSDDSKIYRSDGASTWTQISALDALLLTNAPAEANADVTGNNTAADTTLVNTVSASQVQKRAEAFFKNKAFVGSKDDGLTETPGAGTITRNLLLTTLNHGSGDISLDAVVWNATDSATLNWGSKYEMIVDAKLPSSNGSHTVFIGVQDGTSSAPTTGRHFGFLFEGHADNTYTVKASCADNSTQNTSTIETSSANSLSRRTYRIEYRVTAGQVDFYIDDTNVATLSTNLPSGTTTPCHFVPCSSNDLEVVIWNGYMLINET